MNTNEIYPVFKALGDENRLKIVLKLCECDALCACKLLELVDCAQSTLSHHMKILVNSGIVAATERGKWTHYSINHDVMDKLIAFTRTKLNMEHH